MNIHLGYEAKRNTLEYHKVGTREKISSGCRVVSRHRCLASNRKNKQRKYIAWIIFFTILYSFFSCEDFLETDIKTEIASASVYDNDETATAALVSIYSRIMENASSYASGGSQSFTLLSGLSADEFVSFSFEASTLEFYNNALTPANSTNSVLWLFTYQFIFQANAVIEGLQGSPEVTEVVKRQLEGEAKFIRAFLYFYLVNYFGDVPVITTTDYRTNAVASRASTAQVYRQIIEDLLEAQNLLTDHYTTSERVRPNRWTATALLARVYLFIEDWNNAEIQATAIINSGIYDMETDLNHVFLNDSKEAIWQLMPVRPDINTPEGNNFILIAAPIGNSVSLSDQFINSFENGDIRKDHWVGEITVEETTYYYPYKYKIKTGEVLTEYSMVFRLAEQYLIRAEVRARQGNLTEAIKDIDVIRRRADLPLIQDTDPGMGQAELLDAILHERRIEFFAEWGGHRWLDLKRTHSADAVLGTVKPGWQATDILYPIPQSEIENNPNLTQNEGY